MMRKRKKHQVAVQESFNKFGKNVRFGIDIGGTLCKLVYFEPENVESSSALVHKQRVSAYLRKSATYGKTGKRDVGLEFYCPEIGGTLHFIKFQTSSMGNFIATVKSNQIAEVQSHITPSPFAPLDRKPHSTVAAVSKQQMDSYFTTNSDDTEKHRNSDDVSDMTDAEKKILAKAIIDNERSVNDEVSKMPTFTSMWDSGSPGLSPTNNAVPPVPALSNNIVSNYSEHSCSVSDVSKERKCSESSVVQPLTTQELYRSDSARTILDSNSVADAPPPQTDHGNPNVFATGGGAYKFANLLRQQLQINFCIADELGSLVKGIDFLLHVYKDECYYLKQFHFRKHVETANYSIIDYPYLVVNIGSGVSILKVNGPNDYIRVGGTSLGGGTFYGLTRALTGCSSFQEALQWAERGRSSKSDLLVGDIYGGDYKALGLQAETVASSFGKLVRPNALTDIQKEDLAKSCLIMITNNIGSLANLYAHKVLNLHKPQIIFAGNFLNNNEISKRALAYATDFWSHGKAKALFLKHEGYFGAIGALC